MRRALTIVQNRKSPEDSFVLNWNDEIHNVFIHALEKRQNLGKRSDTSFKPEAWVYCIAEVQNVYSRKEIIPLEKLKNKLDHICGNISDANLFTSIKKRWND